VNGNVVAVGASAGGVEALTRLVGALPRDLPAPVLIVLHIPPYATSVLPHILGRVAELPVAHARDGEPLEPGRVLVAPPDHHVLVMRETVRVVRGPHENNHRPAIDPLFRSVALARGPAAVAVVLTGALDDGAAGVAAVASRGGKVVVQDPEDALYPAMPSSAIAAHEPDHVAPLAEIPSIIDRLAREHVPPANEGETMDDELALEQSFAAFELAALHGQDVPGRPSALGCPSCGGALWETQDGDVLRFRCRVGHAFAPEALLHSQEARVEEALWTALRALEERRVVLMRLSERLGNRGLSDRSRLYRESAADLERQAKVVRGVLLTGGVAGETA
jgi:two-component system, chemotaxis family, protein-glutamate methylesterase/glutaminase